MSRAATAVLVAACASLLALSALSVLPSASAQGHEHGGMDAGVSIAHDAPADGRTFVGNVNHFSVIAHGDDEVPDFHQDIPWRVTLNGKTLAETTSDSGHDYDGVNSFDIVFPATGAYTVEAIAADGSMAAMFNGTVVDGPLTPAVLALSMPEGSIAGQPARFSFFVHAPDPGSIIPHSDCTFEAVKGGRTEFRTKLHTHEDEQVLDYAFAEPGDYTVRVLCFQAYPSARATLFAPLVAEELVTVLPGPPVNTGAAPPLMPPPPAELNAVVTAPAGQGMTLVGTFDPYTVVGPDTLQHLNVLAVDDAGQTIQHVDFTAVLDGPAGQVFASETLHEYDGILEVTARQLLPGPYTLRVTAEGASGSGELAMTYLVAPRAVPINAGLVGVTLDAPGVVAGAPSTWTLGATATQRPFAHGELEIRLTAAGSDIPYLQAKLHTHATGLFPFTVALPTADAYTLDVTPFPLMPELVVVPAASSFTIQPDSGVALADTPAQDASPAVQEASAAPATFLLGALAALAAAFHRRRRA